MKTKYESPLMVVEMFSVNHAIANCTTDTDVTFECMIGPQTDTETVILDGCTNPAQITKCTTASNPLNQAGHSTHTNGSWDSYGNGFTYTAPSGSEGLLYICSVNGSYTTDFWDDSSGTLVHAGSHTATTAYKGGGGSNPGGGNPGGGNPGGGNPGSSSYHCMIAPVSNVSAMTFSS